MAAKSRRRREPTRKQRAESRVHRPGRVAVVLFICAAAAYLGLIGGGEHRQAVARHDPMAGFYPPDMPRYPEGREVPAGVTNVGRSPMRMSYFATDHGPQRVGDYYAAFWRKRGFWVNSDVTHVGGVVAAVDAKHGHLYQLVLRLQGKRTLAFPSVNKAPMAALNRGSQSPVRLFKESKILANTETAAGGRRAHVVLSVNPGTLDENRAHYRAELGRLGYKEALQTQKQKKLAKGLGDRLLVYRNAAGGEVSLALSSIDSERTRVHLTIIGAGR